ncbi:MAG: hypothetical protein HYV07_22405 [Deltaproteobacteria bacterium]|nr:hypothetical protein [Deltaproteobacteria bacterium]
MRSWMTMLLALGLATPAVAQEQPNFRPKGQGKVKAEKLKDSKDKAQPLEVPVMAEAAHRTEAITLTGRVVSHSDGRVLLAVPKAPAELQKLLDSEEYSEAKDAQSISAWTIFKGEAYIPYRVHATSSAGTADLDQLVGKTVRVELRGFMDSDALSITSIVASSS